MPELVPTSDLPAIPARRADSHKGTYGRVVTLAGSRGMAGAACLAAHAVLRAGAGLSILGTPASVAPIAAGHLRCEIIEALPETAAGTLGAASVAPAVALIRDAQVVAVGPGLRACDDTRGFLVGLLPRIRVPLVLDADALNVLALEPALLDAIAAPLVLTPHPGEMARLVGGTTAQVQADRPALAAAFARRRPGLIVLLKGHRSIVTDGVRWYVNETGNPGMATAGTGDVLTGVIAGLIARGLDPFAAAVLGAHVHGRAGDLAAAVVGQESLIATDVLAWLPRAFRGLATTGSAPGSGVPG